MFWKQAFRLNIYQMQLLHTVCQTILRRIGEGIYWLELVAVFDYLPQMNSNCDSSCEFEIYFIYFLNIETYHVILEVISNGS